MWNFRCFILDCSFYKRGKEVQRPSGERYYCQKKNFGKLQGFLSPVLKSKYLEFHPHPPTSYHLTGVQPVCWSTPTPQPSPVRKSTCLQTHPPHIQAISCLKINLSADLPPSHSVGLSPVWKTCMTNNNVNVFLSLLFKDIVQPKKRGVKRVTNRFVLPSYKIGDTFFERLKGLSHEIDFKNFD